MWRCDEEPGWSGPAGGQGREWWRRSGSDGGPGAPPGGDSSPPLGWSEGGGAVQDLSQGRLEVLVLVRTHQDGISCELLLVVAGTVLVVLVVLAGHQHQLCQSLGHVGVSWGGGLGYRQPHRRD